MRTDYFRTFLYAALVAFILICQSCKKDEPASIIETGTVMDIDGRIYRTVKIGDQWCMAENLQCSKFREGSPINFIDMNSTGFNNTDSIWANTIEASFTFINDSIFGYLYNHAVVTDERGIAPAGWRVPTDDDWRTLEKTIGMSEFESGQTGWRGVTEGEKLTAKYSVGWPGGGVLYGTDEFGFNALPGSCRVFDGRTNIFSNTALWWTGTSNGNEGWYRYIDIAERRIFRQHTYPQYGMSIRCVKN